MDVESGLEIVLPVSGIHLEREMYVCMYVCMYACMHACMCIYIYICMSYIHCDWIITKIHWLV